MGGVVLFDGVCNLCSASVRFIAARDRDAFFRFASIQSDVAKELLREHGVAIAEGDPRSIVLIEDGRVLEGSTAALRIARHLNGIWKLGWVLLVVPRFLRDAVYDFIAKRRYRWFGKKDVCMVPTPELRARFL
jgi:predicted DCC family thiol-disulfide oxidoreductase YuxK